MSYYCGWVFRIDKKVRTIQVDIFEQSYTWLKGLCEIDQVLLNTVIIVTSFAWFQHCLFMINVVMDECTILILRTLQFCVCHCCYCLLIYNDSVLLLCLILNCHITFIFSQVLNLFIFGIFKHNGPELDVFNIAIVDIILRSALVRFSILRASYLYKLTRLVCYVYSVYNLQSYC